MLNLSNNKVKDLVPHDRLYSLRALQTPRAGKMLARWILALAVIFFIVLFLPWQQNIHGNGMVTALSPAHRPQVVPTLIAGRIINWKIQEGQYVSKGDTLVIIGEVKEKYFDPRLLQRVQEQITAKQGMLNRSAERPMRSAGTWKPPAWPCAARSNRPLPRFRPRR